MYNREFLEHHGVLGMKWGHRKDDNRSAKPEIKRQTQSLSAKLKDGSTLTLEGRKTNRIALQLAKVSRKVRDNINRSSTFTLRDHKGSVVGDMTLFKEGRDALNVVWVGVDDKHRGHGYGTAATKAAIGYAKSQKLSRVTLEVPGISPDARHIYEKLGFVVDKHQSDKSTKAEEDPIWGGLTSMTLRLK